MAEIAVSPECIQANIANCDKTLELVLQYLDAPDMKLSKEEPGIKFYTGSVPGNSFSVVKSVVLSEGITDKIIENLNEIPDIDPKAPAKERDGIKQRYVFQKEGTQMFFYLAVESGSRLVSDREFVMFRRFYEKDGRKIWMSSNAVDGDKLVPVAKGNVRGIMNFQAFVLEKDSTDANKDKLTFIVHADPQGSIPAIIYNSVAVNQGYSAKKVVDACLAA